MTIEAIKRKNPIFFSQEAIRLFQDKSYGIVKAKNETILQLEHKYNKVFYKVNKKDYNLSYIPARTLTQAKKLVKETYSIV
jgi:hypothetical protein